MEKEITTEEQERCFKLLDEYARTKHNCYVTEFSLARRGGLYNVCFRPLGVCGINDPNLYACKYLQFDVEDVRTTALGTSLPPSIAHALDQALSELLHQP